MIETTIPEINVGELMERVRAQARQPKRVRRSLPHGNGSGPELPFVSMLPSAPAVWIPGTVKCNRQRLDRLIETAREKNEGRFHLPKFLRRFFRKQGGYNRAVLDGLAILAKTNDDLSRRVGDISVCLGQLNGWLLALHEQSDADAAWMKAAAPGFSDMAVVRSGLDQLAANLLTAQMGWRKELEGLFARMDATRAAISERIATVESKADQEMAAVQARIQQTQQDMAEGDRARQDQIERLGGQLNDVSNDLAKMSEELRDELERAGGHLRDLQAQADRLGVHINNLQGFVDQEASSRDRWKQRIGSQADLEKRIHAFEERAMADAALVKGELAEYGGLLHRLLGKDLEKALIGPSKPAAARKLDPKKVPGLDSFYVGFENRFRGPRSEIKKRVAFYLPFLRKARAGGKGRPVVDLGCGRGEWLELLKEHKLEGRGVDLNTAMLSQCQERGLKVEQGDALEFLRSLRANSQGAVTGFHIIEHLPFETLLALIREARRVLVPEGLLILESPNCKNIIVGACSFNIDPTHRNPVFPETAEFMVASQGFEKIRIEYLSPVPNRFEAASPELATIRDLLYGPQDFGIIAYKPKQ